MQAIRMIGMTTSFLVRNLGILFFTLPFLDVFFKNSFDKVRIILIFFYSILSFICQLFASFDIKNKGLKALFFALRHAEVVIQ